MTEIKKTSPSTDAPVAETDWAVLLRESFAGTGITPVMGPERSPDGKVVIAEEKPLTEEQVKEAEAFLLANQDLMPFGMSIRNEPYDLSGIRPGGERLNIAGGRPISVLEHMDALSRIGEMVKPAVLKSGEATSPMVAAPSDTGKGTLADMFRGAQVAVFNISEEAAEDSGAEPLADTEEDAAATEFLKAISGR